MPCEYRGRRAFSVENDVVRVTVTVEGGHIVEILHKPGCVNPLWTPPWPSIEPSQYDAARHAEYGQNAESKLLAGIMGHNLCLDLFGGPSPEEAAAGVTVHGEASVNPYDVAAEGDTLSMRTTLAAAQLAFERAIRIDGLRVLVRETVENLSRLDRPIAWTQHVSLGPPFVQAGVTRFELNATRSRTFEGDFGYLARGRDFQWPLAPRQDGGTLDLSFAPPDGWAGYTAHLVDDPARFIAEANGIRFGYRWRRDDFPWLGIWDENCSRKQPPWSGHTIARGMEFGVSPYPESRRAMIDRGKLFGVPAYRWLPARRSLTVEYEAFFEVSRAT
ncbi:MAG TPA: hypothetical protein VFL57_10920 [Bryobacteraceae bacterium]|nr:hypothetical protein [Bryobacteraceae bacterium]